MTTGEVRAIRERVGTQVEVADRLGITARSISSWETGARPIPRWYEAALMGLEIQAEKQNA